MSNRVECLIKNVDWRDNLDHFEYKISAEGEPISMAVRNLPEFGVLGFSKYVVTRVRIDSSSDEYDRLSRDRRITRGDYFKNSLGYKIF